ncbi:signal transduction histidine kinase [Desulfobaculum xiamenense]|uniref:Signal transduction histidine kinase n=1 Tax=Desulfobaculum xiamenense TaxID=995050 RepID=A0A846QQ13_9BACT|nr:ATP-binding protein [Desulfobaculum xiamenense]NJB69070.1 signal transduction histidine kinase [Desulfobaculum xiamenense]
MKTFFEGLKPFPFRRAWLARLFLFCAVLGVASLAPVESCAADDGAQPWTIRQLLCGNPALFLGGALVTVLLVGLRNRALKRDVRRRTRQMHLELAERKVAERNLTKSKEHLQSIFYATQSLYYVFDEFGVCLDVITSRGDLLDHCHVVSPVGRRLDELFVEPLAGRMVQKLKTALDCGALQVLEYEVRRGERSLWFEGRVMPLSEGRCGPRKVVWISQDITSAKRSMEDIRALSSQLALTEERQRRIIAVELHDSLGQILATSKIKLCLIRKRLQDEKQKALFADLEGQIDSAINLTRTLVWELSPPTLYTLGLVPAVEWLGEKFSAEYGLRFSVRDELTLGISDHGLKVLLFRVVRELMTNVIKHAQAREASVLFSNDAHRLNVFVRDDGVGLGDVARTRSGFQRGFGLLTIQESVRHMGGDVAITPGSGRGTVVHVWVPV